MLMVNKYLTKNNDEVVMVNYYYILIDSYTIIDYKKLLFRAFEA